MKTIVVLPLIVILFSGTILPGVINPVQAARVIQCPDVFETDGTIYKFNSEQFAATNPQDIRWGCLYDIPLDEAQSKGLPQYAGFNVFWLEEKGPHYSYDYGCTSGEIYLKEELKWEIWSQTHHVKALTVASEMKQVSPVDVDAMLVILVEQAEKMALECIIGEIEDLYSEPEFAEQYRDIDCDQTEDSSTQTIPGKLSAISGDVYVRQASSTHWILAKEGSDLAPGDLIFTGEEGLARISFQDGTGKNIIDLSVDTVICMGELSLTREELLSTPHPFMELLEGAFNALTKGWANGSIFSVKAGTTIVGIRGTDFIVTHDPEIQKTAYYLKEGIIDVSETTTNETVELTSGQTLEINQGQMQPVSELKSDVWESLVEKTGRVVTEIPDWVKNNAAWWSEDMIGDSDFAQGIQYLISEGIMTIPKTTQSEDLGDSDEIPSWIKNNAGWWADGQITDDDFVKGIQYLVENGIVRV